MNKKESPKTPSLYDTWDIRYLQHVEKGYYSRFTGLSAMINKNKYAISDCDYYFDRIAFLVNNTNLKITKLDRQ